MLAGESDSDVAPGWNPIVILVKTIWPLQDPVFKAAKQ